MLTAYLDESYAPDHYYVAAFVLADEDLPGLAEARTEVMRAASLLGVDPSAELHAHAVMTARDGWEPLSARARLRVRVYRHWLRNLALLPASVFVHGLRTDGEPDGLSRGEVHRSALLGVLDVVDRFAVHTGEQCSVVADELPDQRSHGSTIAELIAQRRADGHTGNVALRAPIRFEDSRLVVGLQAADAVAYLARRVDGHREVDDRVARAVASMWRTVAPLVRSFRGIEASGPGSTKTSREARSSADNVPQQGAS